jgi:hypothetical protein
MKRHRAASASVAVLLLVASSDTGLAADPPREDHLRALKKKLLGTWIKGGPGLTNMAIKPMGSVT